MAKATGTGQGGKTMDERDLAKEVRNLTLKECRKYLRSGKGKMYEAVLLKLAGQILPRLTEHSGPDGKPIPILNVLEHDDHNGSQEDQEAECKD